MPTIQRSRSLRSVQPHAAVARGESALPSSHHLNVTTAGHVHAVDKAEVRKIFTSGSEGIVAAKEATDGSGTLAVSDAVNVVLHQVEDGLRTSYRLKGSDGQMRLLNFSPDSRTLFFSTTLLNSVQAYSLADGQLLAPGPLHNSTPTVVAVSPDSRLLLTASEEPSTIYLQDRTLATAPLLVQPAASLTPAVQACFHPDRPNIFLLAFKDGTAAIYDATKLFRHHKGLPQSFGGEVHAFRDLHAVSSKSLECQPESEPTWFGASCLGITGSSFISGYRSRAITCGADGKCRLLDFEKGAIIRSWHVRAPATALSVLPLKSSKSALIAVGKVDGKVAIHDLSGALLHEWMAGRSAVVPVIDVQWVKGPSPSAIDSACDVIPVDDFFIELYTVGNTLRSSKTRLRDGVSTSETYARHGDGSLSEPDLADDVSGTVCYKPVDEDSPVRRSDQLGHTYMDLFSPLKPLQATPVWPAESPKRRTTPRPRPRILSTTFVNSRAAGDEHNFEHKTSTHPLADHHSSPVTASSLVNDHTSASILAGIKHQGRLLTNQSKPGSFALFAPYLPQSKSLAKRKSTADRRRSSKIRSIPFINPSLKKSSPRKTSSAVPDEASGIAGNDDIWLTADSEDDGDNVLGQDIAQFSNTRPKRRLIWARQDSMASREGKEKAIHRPSIEFRMSPPISRTYNIHETREKSSQASISKRLSEPALESPVRLETSTPSDLDFTETYEPASTPTPSDAGDETILASPRLQPGFAQSFQGPVSVGSYLPRKSSLAFPGSPVQKRTPLGSIAGNEQRFPQENDQKLRQHDESTCHCCSKMRDEIQALKAELAELRWLVKEWARN